MLNLSGAGLTITPDPYPRRQYVRHGLALMALKYAVDVAVILVVTGTVWTPLDYVLSLAALSGTKASGFPAGLNLWLLLWTLPFLWIGVVLSVRRARDAGLPAWVVVAFFVPLVNYVLMTVLALAPSASASAEGDPYPNQGNRTTHTPAATAAGIIAGTAAGVACVVLGVLQVKTYGLTMFFTAPFVIGAVSAFVANRMDPSGRPAALKVVLASAGFVAGALLLLAIEGAVCILMAAPLAVPLALLGGAVGHSLSQVRGSQGAGLVLLAAIAPAGHMVDWVVQSSPTREVFSAVEIDAPPSRVWEHVISFPDITAAPPWYFRAGLSYPLRARIEGTGPGAIRWCEFSTGAFREPITIWQEPHVLAFDVTDQPPPLQEWSPYRNVYAPHVRGFFTTSKGEFRLVPLAGNRTRLEGRTWYSIKMQPQQYWTAISDGIIHSIHDRVLQHIKREVEGQ